MSIRQLSRLRSHSLAVALRIVAFAGLIGSASAQPAATGEAAQYNRWREFYEQRAADFVVTEGPDQRPLALHPNPLQNYSNPVRSAAQHGTIHLWTDAGRPRAIGSIWSAIDKKNSEQRVLCYEFHSLSEMPLSLALSDKNLWAPTEPGIVWQRFDGAPAPARSRPARLTQMRKLLNDVRTELESSESELRLLTQPVYRYPEDAEDVLDGAIFSFVMGTDPEVFVLLEARPPAAGQDPVWHFAPARFTGGALSLTMGDKVLWESPKWEYKRHQIYDFLFGVERLPAEWAQEDLKPADNE